MYVPRLTPSRPKKLRKDRYGRPAVLQQPFPVPIGSLTDVKPDDAIWRWYHGELCDEGVLVHDSSEAKTVSKMGFFGERRKREEDKYAFVTMKEVVPAVRVSKDDEDGDKESLKEPPKKKPKNNEEYDDEEDYEPLLLDAYEAFFLSYALGCLLVREGESSAGFMSLDSLWLVLCRRESAFPCRFAVYHHFRSKGWVVKDGKKFGADFLLYKHGPPFYHAAYSVKVRRSEEEDDENEVEGEEATGGAGDLTWNELTGLNRVTEAAGKELLIAEVELVDKEKESESDHFGSPAVLKRLRVQEILMRRWVPSQEREEV